MYKIQIFLTFIFYGYEKNWLSQRRGQKFRQKKKKTVVGREIYHFMLLQVKMFADNTTTTPSSSSSITSNSNSDSNSRSVLAARPLSLPSWWLSVRGQVCHNQVSRGSSSTLRVFLLKVLAARVLQGILQCHWGQPFFWYCSL